MTFEERCLANKTTPEYQRKLDQRAEESMRAFSKMVSALPGVPDLAAALKEENQKLRDALGTAAISLDCMAGLDSRNEYHRSVARGAVRVAMGA
jgi:hypothetical protein